MNTICEFLSTTDEGQELVGRLHLVGKRVVAKPNPAKLEVNQRALDRVMEDEVIDDRKDLSWVKREEDPVFWFQQLEKTYSGTYFRARFVK